MKRSGADLGQIDFQNFSAGCFSTESFDVTTKPVEYSGFNQILERIEKQLGQLLRVARKLPEYRYRFAILHQFKEFERAVWAMPGGRRVKMIS